MTATLGGVFWYLLLLSDIRYIDIVSKKWKKLS
jgi:hypothetical protein